jgi:hypothetical protein
MVGHGGGATADGGGGSCKCVEGGDVVTRDLVGVDSEASTTPSPVPSMKEEQQPKLYWDRLAVMLDIKAFMKAGGVLWVLWSDKVRTCQRSYT